MNRTYKYLATLALVAAPFVITSCGGDDSDLSQVVASGDYLKATMSTISGDNTFGEISVTSNTSWEAVSDKDWAVVGTAKGEGNAQIVITTGQNPSGLEQRSATVTVTSAGGVAVKVNVLQEKATETVSLSSTSLTPPEAGGTYNITVTSNSKWSIAGAPDWVTLSATSGNGQAVVQVTVAANPDEQQRSATLTITTEGTDKKQQTISITQDAHVVVLNVDPTSIPAGEGAEQHHFTITSNSSWTITGAPTWITLSATQGTNNQEITLSVQAATSELSRSATLTVTDAVYTSHTATIQVEQAGRTVVISTNPATLPNLPARAGIYTFAVVGNAQWNITSNIQADWFAFTPSEGLGATQTSSIPVTVTLTDNTSSEARTVVLTATSESGKTATCTITQVAATPPSLTTPTATDVARYSAALSSRYSSPLAVTEAGFCYATTANPTIANTTVAVAVDADSYEAPIAASIPSGLRSGTTYYVRAYARNANGIDYSPQITFTTTGDTPGEGENPTPNL